MATPCATDMATTTSSSSTDSTDSAAGFDFGVGVANDANASKSSMDESYDGDSMDCCTNGVFPLARVADHTFGDFSANGSYGGGVGGGGPPTRPLDLVDRSIPAHVIKSTQHSSSSPGMAKIIFADRDDDA